MPPDGSAGAAPKDPSANGMLLNNNVYVDEDGGGYTKELSASKYNGAESLQLLQLIQNRKKMESNIKKLSSRVKLLETE